MILWLLAVCVIGVVAVVNYYQGAVRAAFSLVGLFMAALLAVPMGGLFKPLLRAVGWEHPVLLAFVAPTLAWVVVLVLFKVAGLAVHKKLEAHYKYHDSDTHRLLFERLNQRTGISLGVLNGVAYVYVLGAVVTLLGYFTVQVASSGRDTFGLRVVNSLAQASRDSGLARAVQPFTPRAEFFYDAADVLGLIYHNPLLQSRLSSYPVFLTLAEKQEFQGLASDVRFQQIWQSEPPPTLGELIRYEKVDPLVKSTELYTNVVAMLGGDLKDLKTYLETGKSAKFEDEKILGRWEYDYRESMARTRRTKTTWNTVELTRLRAVLGGVWAKAKVTATVDNQAIVRLGNGKEIRGTWKSGTGHNYTLKVTEDGKSMDVRATVEGDKLVFSRDGVTLVFEK